MLEFIKVEWLGKLFKKLEQLYRQRNPEITRINDIFGDPLLLAKYYVEPRCQQNNPADRDEATSVVRSLVFETLNAFFERDFQIRDGRSQLFVLSDAGMGKTSLLMMLKLMHLTSFWPKEYDCVILKLGPDTLKDIERIEKIENSRQTILLLDALDEDPTAWGRIKDRLLELLEVTKHFHRMVLSCRTQFFSEGGLDPLYKPGQVVVGGFRCPVFFLSLFNDAQVDTYLNKKFPTPWWNDYLLFDRFDKAVAQRNRAKKILDQTGSLKFRPLLLAHVNDLLESELEDWDVYQVYLALVNGCLYRQHRKLHKLYKERGQDNPPDKDDLLEVCIRIAEFMQNQGASGRAISEAQLEELISGDKRIAWLKDFDVDGRSLLNLNLEKTFRFSHYTIQEFLLVYGLLEGKLGRLKSLHFTDQMREFLECNRATCLTELNFDANPTGFVWRDRLREGSLGPDMVLVPGGTFQMGSKYEKPVHQMILKSFAVSRCAVTFAEYKAFCTATRRKAPKDQDWGRGRRPVINISWEDATAYCAWLSEQTGAQYALLTEAQWEYACRAGSKTEFCFGDDEERLGEYAWYEENSNKQTHPVAQKKANAWGLFDMHGNVWEWVQDWYGDYSSHTRQGPDGPKTGSLRVCRGGAWSYNADSCRSACRGRLAPDNRDHHLGFRLARLVPLVSHLFALPYMPAHSMFRDSMKDASQGPEMTALPGGTFRMGEGEKVREVTVQRFAIGVCPVTFAEYEVYCAATGKEILSDEDWGRERRPMINISWEDAKAYCAWLSGQTGAEYRLLRDAEWEYACRAGTETAYYFGDEDSCLGEYAWYSDNSNEQTHPVGEKKPNAWGLFDMHGNVYEWVEDEIGSLRVVRGGAWYSGPRLVRSANRYGVDPGLRDIFLGFRLARRIF